MTDLGSAAARSGAQALERAIAVLGCFEPEAELGVTQVARRVGLSGSTTHRLLRALCRGGLLAQDATSGLYRFGPRMATLGAVAARSLGYDAVQPVLRRLAAETGESFTLGVLDAEQSLTVLSATAPGRGAVPVITGVYGPVHACAMGKALVAFDTSGVDLIARAAGLRTDSGPHPLPHITDHTITDPEVLAAELRATRERGWAANDQELIPDVGGISVPVYAADGHVAAALGVAFRMDRVTRDEFATWADRARHAAEALRGVLPHVDSVRPLNRSPQATGAHDDV